MRVTPLPASTQRIVPWKNGRGVTTELYSDAASPAAAWSWRVSIADVPEAGPFSTFPGVDRYILRLVGEGMRVKVNGQWNVVPGQADAFAFPGEAAVTGEPMGAGVRDVNLMVERARWLGRLWTVGEGARLTLLPDSQFLLHAGRCEARGLIGAERLTVPEGASSLISPERSAGSEPGSLHVESGELIVASVAPRGAS
jgi:environmental stress-induced protein Ves